MWFLGLVIGAIVGAIGGVQGAVLGALCGAGVGWALAQKSAATSDERVSVLESSVRLLQQRVTALEKIIRLRESSEIPPSRVPEDPEFLRPIGSEALPAEPSAPPRPADPGAAESFQPSEISPPDDILAKSPAAPPESPLPSRPAQPSPLWNFFFGGNTVVRFGVIVLFFGVAFLLKYAAEHIEIPIEARLIGVALGAVVMLAIGWRLRQSRPGYA